jgi:hypothetical protein
MLGRQRRPRLTHPFSPRRSLRILTPDRASHSISRVVTISTNLHTRLSDNRDQQQTPQFSPPPFLLLALPSNLLSCPPSPITGSQTMLHTPGEEGSFFIGKGLFESLDSLGGGNAGSTPSQSDLPPQPTSPHFAQPHPQYHVSHQNRSFVLHEGPEGEDERGSRTPTRRPVRVRMREGRIRMASKKAILA